MERERPDSSFSGGSGSRPGSGLGGPAVRPSASLGSNDGAPASGFSSATFKGSADVEPDLALFRKLTGKHCSRGCDPTSVRAAKSRTHRSSLRERMSLFIHMNVLSSILGICC